MPHVNLVNVAASDVIGRQNHGRQRGRERKQSEPWWNSLVTEKTRQFTAVMHEELISTTTLDNYLASQSIVCVDVVKIDTEGFEARVITGFVQSLRAMGFNDCAPIFY